MPPLFSILLPTHNRADVLPFAICSVLAQTLANFELLIVGDGCTDQTAEIVLGFNDPRIIWFDLPKAANFGYANRNIALQQARGTHIAYMAHDDLWFPDHLERLLPLLEQPCIEWVYSQPIWVIPDGKIAPAIFDLTDAPTLELFLTRKKNRIPSASVAHRRACFAQYGYWDASLPRGADWELWTRIIKGGGKANFAYLPEATCLHFHADWRKNARFILEHEIVWEQLYTLDGFVPAAMRITVPAGMSEQQAAWQSISAQPQTWPQTIRAAIRMAYERRVAESDTLMVWMLKRWPDLPINADSLIEHISSLAKREAALHSKTTKIESAQRSPMQVLKQRLIPQGTMREKIWRLFKK